MIETKFAKPNLIPRFVLIRILLSSGITIPFRASFENVETLTSLIVMRARQMTTLTRHWTMSRFRGLRSGNYVNMSLLR